MGTQHLNTFVMNYKKLYTQAVECREAKAAANRVEDQKKFVNQLWKQAYEYEKNGDYTLASIAAKEAELQERITRNADGSLTIAEPVEEKMTRLITEDCHSVSSALKIVQDEQLESFRTCNSALTWSNLGCNCCKCKKLF